MDSLAPIENPSTTPEPVPNPTPPSGSAHHHVTGWVALVIIAAIAATVGYLVGAEGHKARPFDFVGPWSDIKQGDFSSETAEWKTYRNEEHRFELDFNDKWKGYAAISSNDSILFKMPSVGLEPQVMVDVMAIVITPSAEWESEAILSQRSGNIMQSTFIARDETSVFSWRNTDPTGLPVSFTDMQDVISTFRFIEPAGWEAYSNKEHGFEFKYPNNFELYEGSDVEAKAVNLSYIPPCDSRASVCAVYSADPQDYKGTNFSKAGFSVRTVNEATTAKQCQDFYPESSGDPKADNLPEISGQSKYINDTIFYMATDSGAGLGHWGSDILYRTFHNNICLELDLRISATNIGVYEPELGVKEFNEEKVWSQLDGVLQTFKLIEK